MTLTADGSPRRTTPPAAGSAPHRNPHRLDELVWHLSGCHPAAARRALADVDAPVDFDAAITAVAQALVTVRSRVPVPA
jgi:hypothetical protein